MIFLNFMILRYGNRPFLYDLNFEIIVDISIYVSSCLRISISIF